MNISIFDVLNYSGNSRTFYLPLAHKLGINTAVLYSVLIYLDTLHKADADGFFYTTREIINENTSLSPDMQRSALEKLKEFNLVECKMMGMPAMMYYKINKDISNLERVIYGENAETSQGSENATASSSENLGQAVAKGDSIYINNKEDSKIDSKPLENKKNNKPDKFNRGGFVQTNGSKSLFNITPQRPAAVTTQNNLAIINMTDEAIKYLNEKAGRKFRPTGGNYSTYIAKLMAQGYLLDDFKYVIDVKTEEWQGTDADKYLRPETLFGGKFASYRQQKMKKDLKSKSQYDQFEKKRQERAAEIENERIEDAGGEETF